MFLRVLSRPVLARSVGFALPSNAARRLAHGVSSVSGLQTRVLNDTRNDTTTRTTRTAHTTAHKETTRTTAHAKHDTPKHDTTHAKHDSRNDTTPKETTNESYESKEATPRNHPVNVSALLDSLASTPYLTHRMRTLRLVAALPIEPDNEARARILACFASQDKALVAQAAQVESLIASHSKTDLTRTETNILRDLDDLTHKKLDCEAHALAAYDALDANYKSQHASVHNDVLQMLAARGETEHALNHVKMMIETFGVQPNVTTYSLMILAYGNAKNAVEAQKWFDVYRNSDEPTSNDPYNNLISAYVSSGDIPAALNVMSTILAEDSIPLTASHMTAFLASLLANQQHAQVIEWYTRLETDTSGQFPQPDSAVRDIAFESALHLRNEPLIEKLYPASSDRVPNGLTLSLYALSKLDPSEPDVVTATRVLNTIQKSETMQTPLLFTFLDSMVHLSPKNKRAGTDMMVLKTGVARGVLPAQIQWLLAQALVNVSADVPAMLQLYREASRIVSPTRNAKEVVIKSFVDHGKWNEGAGPALDLKDFETLLLLTTAKQHLWKLLVADMKARKLRISRAMNNRMMDELKAQGKTITLIEWIRYMRSEKIITGPRLDGEPLTLETLSEVNKQILDACHSRHFDQAVSIYNEMLSTSPFLPSIHAMSTLLFSLIKSDRVQEAQTITTHLLPLASQAKDAKLRVPALHDAFSIGHLTNNDIPAYLDHVQTLLATTHTPPSRRSLLKLTNDTVALHMHRVDKAPALEPIAGLLEKVIPRYFALPTREAFVAREMAFTPTGWNDIMWIYTQTGRGGRALEVFQHVRDAGIRVRPGVHRALFVEMARTMDKVVVMEMLDDAIEEMGDVKGGGGLQLDGLWFDSAVEMLVGRFGDVDAAVGVWELVRRKGLRLGGAGYRVLVGKEVERGNVESAVRVMCDMGRVGERVDNDVLDRMWGQGGKEVVEALKGEEAVAFGQLVGYKGSLSSNPRPSQEILEAAVKLVVENKPRSKLVVQLTEMLLQEYKSLSSTPIANLVLKSLVETSHFDNALLVFESMAPFSAKLPTSRDLNTVALFIFNAAKADRGALVDRGVEVMKADGFPEDEVAAVTEGVQQIRGKLVVQEEAVAE
ncbi:hypothetical protein HDU98_002247 [Podochytrium sp. JEL0797]|nr:hypothetical protein HDU98_002247 [Podochytrium sp. JEL0797]